MKIAKQASDEAILSELGGRLTRVRLEQNLTQAQLAEQAGVSKRTVERLEAGTVDCHPWNTLGALWKKQINRPTAKSSNLAGQKTGAGHARH